MCVCAREIKRGYGYVRVSSSTKSQVDSSLCVYIMDALQEVLKRGAPRDVCVLVHARLSMGIDVCGVCPLYSTVDSYLCEYTYAYSHC